MKSAVIIFPGSNCDRDAIVALEQTTGQRPVAVWHKETSLPSGIDLILVPGGFSYGDYLRCGAIAGNSPIISELKAFAAKGGAIIGICNGFQILTETQLLPGALIRNASLNFVCRNQALEVASTNSLFTQGYKPGEHILIPVAHHDGNYRVDESTHKQLLDEDRVAFRYVDNPNGSLDDIAGVLSENRRILGMMPHPERAVGGHEGGTDGSRLFESLLETV